MIHGISAGYARSSNTWANGKRWRRERKNVTRAVFRTIRAISDPNKGKEFLEAKKPWRVLPTPPVCTQGRENRFTRAKKRAWPAA